MKANPTTLSVETVFRALSDGTRLRILNLLQGGELCVCDLVTVLDVPQPTASRHLAYLRKAGLVLARKEGLWHYYRLSEAEGLFHTKVLECLASLRDEVPDLADDETCLRQCGRTDCCD